VHVHAALLQLLELQRLLAMHSWLLMYGQK
jgi:hypothetical protein